MLFIYADTGLKSSPVNELIKYMFFLSWGGKKKEFEEMVCVS